MVIFDVTCECVEWRFKHFYVNHFCGFFFFIFETFSTAVTFTFSSTIHLRVSSKLFYLKINGVPLCDASRAENKTSKNDIKRQKRHFGVRRLQFLLKRRVIMGTKRNKTKQNKTGQGNELTARRRYKLLLGLIMHWNSCAGLQIS